MDKIDNSLVLLRDYIASNNTLNKEEVDDIFKQAKDSLEREAFLLILTEELNEEEQEIYKEVLSLE
ncbi:MAG: hypothetical protein LBF15_06850 [Candidatus Peribacteria bacterium]|jgi:hypothetical protein|nr:hypothetical protein [Candidatus Peribacteria bacterium]